MDRSKENYKKELETLSTENQELNLKKNTNEAFIIILTEQLEEKEKELSRYVEEYDLKLSSFQENFDEEKFAVELELEISDDLLEGLKTIKNTTLSKYELFYQELPEKFQETKNKGNEQINEQVELKTFSFKAIEQVLLGGKIGHLDKITPYLFEANEQRINIADIIYETMLKIFTNTKDQYENYELLINDLNTFFTGKKISNEYYFNINFIPKPKFNIAWIDSLHYKGKGISKINEVFYNSNNDVEAFVIDFFQKEVKGVKVSNISELLNPKNYFELSVSLTDENKKPIPGSTGETYSAITLLGIGRLSIVQNSDRKGIRFIILEETASLDNTNFNTFPDIASEFKYQLVTMTPKPYSSNSDHGWYLHHLIKGKANRNINYPVPASYFKTNNTREDLNIYLAGKNK